MRLLLGLILGCALTIGAVYVTDHRADAGARPMVNWDVVGQNWNSLASRARAEWNRLAE